MKSYSWKPPKPCHSHAWRGRCSNCQSYFYKVLRCTLFTIQNLRFCLVCSWILCSVSANRCMLRVALTGIAHLSFVLPLLQTAWMGAFKALLQTNKQTRTRSPQDLYKMTLAIACHVALICDLDCLVAVCTTIGSDMWSTKLEKRWDEMS